MLERCRNAQERWGGVNMMLGRWLQERAQLVRVFRELKRHPAGQRGRLPELNGLLVDYCSAAHFEIYEQLHNEARSFGDHQALSYAARLYPRLETLTERILAFTEQVPPSTRELPLALASLGALLCERFELEDCLVEILHEVHAPQQGASFGGTQPLH